MISKRTIGKLDNANVIDMYLSKNMTYDEIQNILHISSNTLKEYLDLNNVKRRDKKKRKEIRKKAPLGKKYGLWTVISDEVKSSKEINSNFKGRQMYYNVQCSCGEQAWVSMSSLKNKESTRCKKCANKEYINDEGDVDLLKALKSVLLRAKNGINKRKKVSKLPFTITVDYLYNLYNETNGRCALSGEEIEFDKNKQIRYQNLSIDRIDSNKGYEIGNIQLVDKRINMMKGTLSNDEFIDLCKKIVEFNSKCG